VRVCFGATLALLLAAPLAAQPAPAAADVVRLIEAGDFASARSEVLRLWTETGDSLHADERASALFLRGALASDLEAAEIDFRRIIVEHPYAPDADAALHRLALLRLERGDREDADRLLTRFLADYPQSPLRESAEDWRRRMAAGDPPRGTASPATPSTPARGAWAVQVAAFRTEAAANAFAAELIRRGFQAETRPPTPEGWVRVRVGAFPTSAATAPLVRRLREAGYETAVVRDAD
jgi:tetratricopeptide (TPR) repeat protein